MSLSDEQLVELGRKVVETRERQKAYDKWYLAKARHDLAELKRVVKENDLESQLTPFNDSKENYA